MFLFIFRDFSMPTSTDIYKFVLTHAVLIILPFFPQTTDKLRITGIKTLNSQRKTPR